jgi:aconitate hydratase
MALNNGGFMIVGGENYGQGSSREHAAIAPRYLGLRAVIVKSYARIHKANLINFGILPPTFADPADWEEIEQGDELRLEGVREALGNGGGVEPPLILANRTKGNTIELRHDLDSRQAEMIVEGSLINVIRGKHAA